MILLKQLFSRRWLSGTLLVLFAMGLFARLGIWQLDRLDQRRAQNALLRAALDAPPLDLAQPLPGLPDALENRLAIVTGHYDFAEERLVLLQTWEGRTGVQLVTPLLIEGMGGEATAVLVNRGWVPQAEYEAGTLADYQTATNVIEVSGYLALSQPGREDTLTAAPLEVYRIDISAIEAALPYKLLPIVLVEAPGEAVEVEPPFRAQREVDLSEGPHLSYAWQWFIFAVMTGGLYLYFVRRSEQKQPESSEIPYEKETD